MSKEPPWGAVAPGAAAAPPELGLLHDESPATANSAEASASVFMAAEHTRNSSAGRLRLPQRAWRAREPSEGSRLACLGEARDQRARLLRPGRRGLLVG